MDPGSIGAEIRAILARFADVQIGDAELKEIMAQCAEIVLKFNSLQRQEDTMEEKKTEKMHEIMARIRVCDVPGIVGEGGDLWEALASMAEREVHHDQV